MCDGCFSFPISLPYTWTQPQPQINIFNAYKCLQHGWALTHDTLNALRETSSIHRAASRARAKPAPHTHTQRCSCVSALTGHGEVAVTVIGSCCWGQTSDSQLSVIIYHRSSCGLDASACVCVCARVCVCACICHSERASILLVISLHWKREEKCRGEGERGELDIYRVWM